MSNYSKTQSVLYDKMHSPSNAKARVQSICNAKHARLQSNGGAEIELKTSKLQLTALGNSIFGIKKGKEGPRC